MEEAPTCGKGLAEHSALPVKVADLIAALAENLKVHMKALDLTDASSRTEFDAYERLATEYEAIAARLDAAAQQMAGYRDLSMGRHDPAMMSSEPVRHAFEKYVAREQELLTLLQDSTERDRSMLRGMSAADGS